MWVMMSNHALSFNDHFFCTGWQTMPVFVFNIIYKPLLTSGTRVFLFNIILTEVDTFTSITHHYSNAITQFITQFITQIPLLKSLLIITQMSFSLLIITPPLLKGHFADDIWKNDSGLRLGKSGYPGISQYKFSKMGYPRITWDKFDQNVQTCITRDMQGLAYPWISKYKNHKLA